MNTIAIVANVPLAGALAATCRKTLGDGDFDLHHLDVDFDQSAEDSEESVRAFIASLPKQDGLLILTDLFGATPDNLARAAQTDTPSRVVSGANLSMLLRACNYLHRPLDELARIAVEGGARGICSDDD